MWLQVTAGIWIGNDNSNIERHWTWKGYRNETKSVKKQNPFYISQLTSYEMTQRYVDSFLFLETNFCFFRSIILPFDFLLVYLQWIRLIIIFLSVQICPSMVFLSTGALCLACWRRFLNNNCTLWFLSFIDLQAKGDPKLLFPEQKITYDC